MQWIDPTDYLPDHSNRVLVVCNDKDELFKNHIRIARFRGDRNKWTTAGFRLKEVLLWMELPPIPERYSPQEELRLAVKRIDQDFRERMGLEAFKEEKKEHRGKVSRQSSFPIPLSK